MTKKIIGSLVVVIIVIILAVICYFCFIKTSNKTQTGLPNPASVHCEEVGGTLDIRTNPDGGQVGYCTLPDKTVCEEWVLLRNECAPKVNPPVACTMEAKLCPDGSSVGRTGPKCEFAKCPASDNSGVGDFRNLNIKAGDQIVSPLKITGEVKGGWFFEGTFPINLVDWDGKIIATGLAESTSEWMTADYVSFTSEIKFTKPVNPTSQAYAKKGAIIFKKDNESGLPVHDKSYELPIAF